MPIIFRDEVASELRIFTITGLSYIGQPICKPL